MSENGSLQTQDQQARRELQGALLNLVDLHVRNEYLNEIETASVVPLEKRYLNLTAETNLRLFHIDKISYSSETRISDKLKAFFEALTPACDAVVFFLDGRQSHIDLYMGVYVLHTGKLSGEYAILSSSFQALYPGSEIRRLKNLENRNLIESFFPKDEKLCIAAVSGTPIAEYNADRAPIEKIDSLVDAMKHKPFTLMVIGKPIQHQELMEKRRVLENLYSEIYPLQKQDISLSRNESQNFGRNFSTTITVTDGTSTGTSTTHSEGGSEGTNERELPDNSDKERAAARNNLIGLGISAAVTLATGLPLANGQKVATVAANLIHGLFFGSALSNAFNSAESLMNGSEGPQVDITKNKATNFNDSETNQNNVNHSLSNARQEGTNEGESYSSGKSVQVSYINKSVVDLLERIQDQINEVKAAEMQPMFSLGAYILAGDEETAVNAANTYRSVVSSHGKVTRLPNVYKWSDAEDVSKIVAWLKLGMHPKFSFENSGLSLYPHMSLAQPVKSGDMAAFFCLPERTVSGIDIVKHAAFPRDVIFRNRLQKKETALQIDIGKLAYMGVTDEETPVTIPVDELTKHLFVAGTTGVGKSNFCYQIIHALVGLQKKVLVIEPAKGEYARAFGGREDFRVYGTNIRYTPLLRINPFAFPEGISVEEHIESLMDIFCNAWPMYSAMPAILKDALEQVYENNGFDLQFQTRSGNETFPTFSELLEVLPQLIRESNYSKEVQGNYTGALVTRIKSMTNGIYGAVFCRNEIGDEALFDENVIIDISRVRSEETKALIMGVLVNRLSEYRMCSGNMNSPLQHITLLEEAHHLLRRQAASSVEGANMRGASVEMISNAIAEMRTYGEGFIIADQRPSIMDRSVISNTQTKAFFMLPEQEDRSVAANSLELNPEQQSELARLPIGIAIMYQNAWCEPVMVKINYFDPSHMVPFRWEIPDIAKDTKRLLEQTLAVLLYSRMGNAGGTSTYDKDCADMLLDKSLSWMGDAEALCKAVLRERESLLASKAPASRIAEVYAVAFDFKKQMAVYGSQSTIEQWLFAIRKEIRQKLMLSDAEIDELLGVLIFSQRTTNSAALKIYGEYQKNLSRREAAPHG